MKSCGAHTNPSITSGHIKSMPGVRARRARVADPVAVPGHVRHSVAGGAVLGLPVLLLPDLFPFPLLDFLP